MLASVDTLIEVVHTFLAQDDARVLVVACDDDEATLFVSALAAVSEHARGLAVALPDPWNDAARAPLLELLPPDGVLGVIVCPTSGDDADAGAPHTYAMITEDAPWQPRIRWVVRDTRTRGALRARIVASTNVAATCRWATFALAHDDHAARLAGVACDVERRATDRLASLHQLAWLDVSHGHHDVAIERFGVLHAAYQARGEVAMQSLCLQGVAAVHRHRHDAATALTWFQRAAAVALSLGVSMPLLASLLGAAESSYETGALLEAEQYFGEAARVAAALQAWLPLCDALMKAGVVAVARGDISRAAWHWEQCRKVSAKMQHDDARREVLTRLEALYAQVGLHDRAHDAVAERHALSPEAP